MARTRLELGSVAARRRAVDDLDQLVLVEVVDHELEQEPVELRFGQGVGALHLERVLRAEHEERLVELVGVVSPT